MQNEKERLNIDLSFLDEAKPPKAQMQAASKYKYNWRNIIVIVGIVIGLCVWGSMNDNSSRPRPAHSSYTQPAANSDTTVSNGQFKCSSYDSQQADSLSPVNEFAVNKETDDLNHRADELDVLSKKINTSAVDGSSPQYLIDNYNQMIESYNTKLTTFKADSAAHHQKVERFNAQVEAHNNYLISHCTRAY